MVGRLLAGVATSLLFSVFESWLVTEHNARKYSEESLSRTFALATFGNGLTGERTNRRTFVPSEHFFFFFCLFYLQPSDLGLLLRSSPSWVATSLHFCLQSWFLPLHFCWLPSFGTKTMEILRLTSERVLKRPCQRVVILESGCLEALRRCLKPLCTALSFYGRLS